MAALVGLKYKKSSATRRSLPGQMWDLWGKIDLQRRQKQLRDIQKYCEEKECPI